MAKKTANHFYCTSCGHELKADAKFCADCGTPTQAPVS